MKKITLIIITSLFLLTNCINTKNAKIEKINETYYMITTEKGNKYCGKMNEWCSYPDGDYINDEKRKLNEVLYKHLIEIEIKPSYETNSITEDEIIRREKIIKEKEKELNINNKNQISK